MRLADHPQDLGGENDDPVWFRWQEHQVLVQARDDLELEVEPCRDLDAYGAPVSGWFSRVSLVKRLRETRVLTGFSRVFPENDLSPAERRAMLRRHALPRSKDWLPAYVVHGEGVFLEIGDADGRLTEWENSEPVLERVEPLLERFTRLRQSRHLQPVPLMPRFLLVHTLSHLLMNRLVFECGYSSAAMRERIYVSDDPDTPMAGLLIYTADGDSEGTLGGLVRMGGPERLGVMLHRALESAMWCSADPVCAEMGARGGQGPDSCNLAACHSCCLVPETACEYFNRYLDRGLVVGAPGERGIGFFEDALQLAPADRG